MLGGIKTAKRQKGMDMGAKKLVWKSEKMQAVFDAEQAVWTSSEKSVGSAEYENFC